MPWKAPDVSEVRLAACHAVRSCRRPVAAVARDFGVARKTLHKWLRRFDEAGEQRRARDLADRSRRPHRSPKKTDPEAERRVLDVRDRYNWGPRKIHFFLKGQEPQHAVPAIRTVADVLARHGRVARPAAPDADAAPAAVQRFERAAPNELWQADFQGPVEVGRRKLMPFVVLDDHSRYCLSCAPCPDVTMATAFALLWDVFGDAGLPEAMLTDNAFNTMGTARPAGISWFDARLVRLGVLPRHGRPYHPQTQGKLERHHRSAWRESIGFDARRGDAGHFAADCERYRQVYNHLRPHEAIGDVPPAARWRPSARRRPPRLPEVEYPPGSLLRVVNANGTVGFRGYAVLCGRGIAGEPVRLEERDRELVVFYGWKTIRCLSIEQLVKGKVL